MLRNAWRGLTSMRTALVLLFLLALAALPGALLPQRSLNQRLVDAVPRRHPRSRPSLDRLGFFDVFAAPWFAAIYLLLMVSLVGCVLPRTVEHATALRGRPVATPRNLARLPHHAVGHARRRAGRGRRARSAPGCGAGGSRERPEGAGPHGLGRAAATCARSATWCSTSA